MCFDNWIQGVLQDQTSVVFILVQLYHLGLHTSIRDIYSYSLHPAMSSHTHIYGFQDLRKLRMHVYFYCRKLVITRNIASVQMLHTFLTQTYSLCHTCVALREQLRQAVSGEDIFSFQQTNQVVQFPFTLFHATLREKSGLNEMIQW